MFLGVLDMNDSENVSGTTEPVHVTVTGAAGQVG